MQWCVHDKTIGKCNWEYVMVIFCIFCKAIFICMSLTNGSFSAVHLFCFLWFYLEWSVVTVQCDLCKNYELRTLLKKFSALDSLCLVEGWDHAVELTPVFFKSPIRFRLQTSLRSPFLILIPRSLRRWCLQVFFYLEIVIVYFYCSIFFQNGKKLASIILRAFLILETAASFSLNLKRIKWLGLCRILVHSVALWFLPFLKEKNINSVML